MLAYGYEVEGIPERLSASSFLLYFKITEKVVVSTSGNISNSRLAWATPGWGDPDAGLGFSYWDNTCRCCQAQWEVYKMVLLQFFGIEFVSVPLRCVYGNSEKTVRQALFESFLNFFSWRRKSPILRYLKTPFWKRRYLYRIVLG